MACGSVNLDKQQISHLVVRSQNIVGIRFAWLL
jgi:hypothetical protein